MDYSAEILCELQKAGGTISQGALRRKLRHLAEIRDELFDKDAAIGAMDDLLTLKKVRARDGNWELI